MFNLEEAISEWRRRMLGAGIKSPVPLEELEIHLREEIEQRIKSGLNDADAFYAAAKKMGQAQLLETEFKKVGKGRRLAQTILLMTGWLAAGFLLAACILGWDFDWNFFNFSPNCGAAFLKHASGMLFALTGFWFLARVSRTLARRIGASIICALLLTVSVLCLPGEKIKPGPTLKVTAQMTDQQAIGAIMKYRIESVFTRSKPSPLWFRGGRALLLAVPSVFLVWSVVRQRIRPDDPSMGHGPILPN